MQFFLILFIALQFILISYFLFITIYSLVLAVAGLVGAKYRRSSSGKVNRIAVFIPAYKEDAVIYKSALNLTAQKYPGSNYDVFVIADTLEDCTLSALRKIPVGCISVKFDFSTKVKALNAAFDQVDRNYDICVIFDADNFAEPDFLSVINEYFNAGYLSIQGQRKPKNTDTKMAVLDGLSEAINNHLVRAGTCALGGSSAIAGSGFAVDYKLLKKTLLGMDSIGGFDKELEIRLLQQGVRTVYVKEAVVYDEKVQSQEVFKNQRKRWIASQFYYLRKYWKQSLKAFMLGNFTLFNSAFLRYAQLPRFLNLGLLFFSCLIIFFVRESLFVSYYYYLLFFVLFLGSIFISIPASLYTSDLLKAGLVLPKTFFNMFLLLFKLKGANKKFIHTPHKTSRN